jgi:hypothetical protein
MKYAIEYSIFIFIFHIPASFYTHTHTHTHTQKKLVMTCKFECLQSHCHILKEFYEFLCRMDASIILGQGSFRYIYIYIYIYLGKLWIGHKVIWECMCNLGGNRKKTKCHKMNVHPFTNRLR